VHQMPQHLKSIAVPAYMRHLSMVGGTAHATTAD